jgi:hypothetical protein
MVTDFVAEFNHDGNVDLLETSCSPFRGCGEFLFLNNGDGTLSVPPGTNALVPGVGLAGDFDGDGYTDLLGPFQAMAAKFRFSWVTVTGAFSRR